MISAKTPDPVLPPSSPLNLLSPWPLRLALAALTAITFLINGYHPLAEDGGLYVAGIEYNLNPTLFPHYTAFVTEHLHFSLFAPAIVAFIHLTHIPLAWTLLLVYLFSIALTLYAAAQILSCCTTSRPAQLAGVSLLSAFWTLPIAGTSLMLMDPYVTARSLSTPLSLFAIAFSLGPWIKVRMAKSTTAWPSLLACAISLILAALFHPLMAAYTLAFIIILRLTCARRSFIVWFRLFGGTLILAAAINLLAPPESPAVLAAEFSRYYWFVSQWHWFELLGLAGPLIVLALILRRYCNHPSPLNHAAATLCRAGIATGLIAFTVALLFAREGARVHLVARLQPLRIFLPIYAVMTLLLGATFYQLVLEARQYATFSFQRRILASLPAISLLAVAAIMFYVQRRTFPASDHLEIPSLYAGNPNSNANPPRNPWVRAFLWARDNTDRDALFALDAHYIQQPDEDAQTFRATALRSALPDFSKDGGEAAIAPALAALWQPSAAAQAHLDTGLDALRDARILPLGATWMVLRSTTPTNHPCPYNNGTVKVCHLE